MTGPSRELLLRRDKIKDARIGELESKVEWAGLNARLEHERAERAEVALEQKELVCTRLRTSWREDTADLGRFDDALHSAYQDWLDDFPDDCPMDYDKWLACHVTCGKEMRAP